MSMALRVALMMCKAGRASADLPIMAAIDFRGADGQILANSHPFSFKGAAWFGPESEHVVPEGLDRAPMDFYFNFLAQNNFNALRLPFNHKAVRQNSFIPLASFSPILNPELINVHTGTPVRYLEMLQAIADAAAKHNILVVLACDRLSADAFPGNGLWYEEHGALDEAATQDSWSRLAQALCGKWNVVAADLMNEPHKATWAKNDPRTDWDKGATRVGNHVLNQCGRWLILVQGIYMGATGDGGASKGYWWGENLWGAIKHPIALSIPSKLVYAPHTYGPSVYEHHYFRREEGFPDNMPSIWNQHFLNARKPSTTPFVVGQMGGSCASDADRQWHEKAVSFFQTQRVGVFYVALNPTWQQGGLLKDDWRTPNTDKLEALSLLPSTDVASLLPPSPPPPPGCRWKPGTPCHFACTMTNTLAGCTDTGRADMETFEAGGPCFYCGHFNGDPAQCVTRYFQVPNLDTVELKRCEFVEGVCTAEVERQACSASAPVSPSPAQGSQPGSTERAGAEGDTPSATPSPNSATSTGMDLADDPAAGAPIFAGILIILTCGSMGVMLGTGCLGLGPKFMAKRKHLRQNHSRPPRRIVHPMDLALDDTDDAPPSSSAHGRAMGFSFISRQAKHAKGAMRLPDDDEDGLELDLRARPAPAPLSKSRGLSSVNYDL